MGPSTYIFPEDEGQDGSRELSQEDDEDEEEELPRQERACESSAKDTSDTAC